MRARSMEHTLSPSQFRSHSFSPLTKPSGGRASARRWWAEAASLIRRSYPPSSGSSATSGDGSSGGMVRWASCRATCGGVGGAAAVGEQLRRMRAVVGERWSALWRQEHGVAVGKLSNACGHASHRLWTAGGERCAVRAMESVAPRE